MALKTKFKTREEIPAELQPHYVEQAGEWVLDHDGKAKIEEFRQSNIGANQIIADLKKRFDGIDPDEFRRLVAENQSLRTATLSEDAKREMESQLKTAKTGFDKQLAAVTGERDTLNSRLSAIQIDDAVVTEATQRGLRPTALADIKARARATFKLVEGQPRIFEADGTTCRMGKDGTSPMTLAEWVEALVSSAPHLFEANAGGGAVGSGGGAAGNRSVKNPFRKDTFNLTEILKLKTNDPQMAARLEALAGS